MLRGTYGRIVLALFAALALGLAVAACGGGSSSSTADSTEGSGTNAAETGTTSESSDGASLAAAKEAIAPFVGQPSPFTVTEDLNEIPKGAKIAYADCGTPVCAIFGEVYEAAANTMGVSIERVKAGSSANSVASAFDTIVAMEPDAVIAVAEDVELWKKQLKELQDKEIPIVTTGIVGTEPYGIIAPYTAEKQATLEGEMLANYVAAEMNPEANVVIYNVPELPFAAIITEKFTETLESVCPECSVREGQVGIEEFGNSAPNTIVSDLQAHTDSNVAVFTTAEMATGLPAALQAAGIEVETLGNGPGPTNLQYIKEGKETAGFATDLAVMGWSMVDQAAREIIGQELTGPQAEGASVKQFLTKEDITFDPEKGWTGYTDFEERFKKLWGLEG